MLRPVNYCRASLQQTVIALILLSLFSCTPDPYKSQLKKPFPEYKVARFETQQTTTCGSFPAYIGNLKPPSKYQQHIKTKDQLSEKNAQIFEKKTQGIKEFERHMTGLVDTIVNTYGHSAHIQCYTHHLTNWANHQALLTHNINKTGKAIRKWTLASIAASYIRLDLSQAIDSSTKQTIENWLSLLAAQVIMDYKYRSARLRNNHDYWAAWAVINVAVITQNKEYFGWAHQQWVKAMTDINSRGFLANELKRGTKTREYHNFAIMPLVGLAAFINANQTINYNNNDWQAYQRLITLMTNNILSHQDFEHQVGKQMNYDILNGGRLAWIPMHLSIHSVDKRIACRLQYIIENNPSNSYSRLGGETAKYYPRQTYCTHNSPRWNTPTSASMTST
jgi:poly(beta-D-mannuronate) lyase